MLIKDSKCSINSLVKEYFHQFEMYHVLFKLLKNNTILHNPIYPY